MGSVKDIDSIIDRLQGTDGIIDKLNAFIKEFEKKKLVDYTIIELDKNLAKFQEYYSLISSSYESFFAAYIEVNNEFEKQMIKLFLDYCLIFLNRIQNKYCNPIQYRINQKKANFSIGVGVFSVFLAVILSLISFLFPNDSNEKAVHEINQMQKSSNTYFRAIDSTTYYIGLKNDMILQKIDSLKFYVNGANASSISNSSNRKAK